MLREQRVKKVVLVRGHILHLIDEHIPKTPAYDVRDTRPVCEVKVCQKIGIIET